MDSATCWSQGEVAGSSPACPNHFPHVVELVYTSDCQSDRLNSPAKLDLSLVGSNPTMGTHRYYNMVVKM